MNNLNVSKCTVNVKNNLQNWALNSTQLLRHLKKNMKNYIGLLRNNDVIQSWFRLQIRIS